MKRWYRYWAEYPFAHTLSKEEEYFFFDEMDDVELNEDAREWAEGTPDGQAISGLVGRSIRCGFERVDGLPPGVRERQIERSRGIIEHQVQILRSLLK